MGKNQVFVTTDLQDKQLWHREIKLSDVHWINDEPDLNMALQVRTRYRAPLVTIKQVEKTDNNLIIHLDEDVRAITPGQSAVIYDGDHCLGGGIVI